MIRVLMASTSYPADAHDWRGLFIRHLIEAIARRPEVSLQLWSPPGVIPANATYLPSVDEGQWLASLMSAGGVAHSLRSRGLRAITVPLRLLAMLRRAYRHSAEIDLVHVNWLQNAIVMPADGRPLLMTALGTDMALLSLPGVTPLLRRVCRRRRTAICPNAGWMVPALERAFGDLATIQFVPFGIDPCWFKVERAWKQDETARWLCVTRLTRGKLGSLFAWGNPYFSSGKRELHLFGPMQEEVDLPDWVHYHGPISPDSLCKEWFPQACGLITLSQHAEGRPQVMLEAMAAGLPIIASHLPAHEDLLRHRETGWLCGQTTEVGDALEALEDPDTNTSIGLRARQWVGREVGTWDDCAARYVKLYQDLIGGHMG